MILTRVEFHSLLEIEEQTQTFKARFYICLRLPGAALDPDLSKPSDEFPVDSTGKPTFKPSARWYATQIDFVNADRRDSAVLDRKAVVVGDDLEIRVRFEGKFFDRMDLREFPFDDQWLSTSLVLYCRRDGPMPVTIEVSNDCVMDVRERGFFQEYLWELDRTIMAYTNITDLGGRPFPSLTLNLHVLRKPWFVLKSVFLPISIIAFMTFAQFTFKYEHINDRVTGMLTLVLTAAAAKLSTDAYMPSLSYATFLDRILFFLDGVIVLAVVETLVVSSMNRLGVSDDTKVIFEYYAGGFQLAIYIFLHVWFICRGLSKMHLARESMVMFKADKNRDVVRVPSLQHPGRQVRVRRLSSSSRDMHSGHVVRQLAQDYAN